MPSEYKLDLPLFVGGETKKNSNKTNKRFWFTLNNYRNWHYQTSNAVKAKFKKVVESQILALPDLTALWGQVRFHYVYYAPDRKLRDLNNVVGVIDKFFGDALVELGRLEDDNLNFVPAYSCEFGSIDKYNPRMEVFIRPYCQPQATGATMATMNVYTPRKITPQNESMLPTSHTPETRKSYVLINLTEEEIAEAVRNYIRAQIPTDADSELPVKFIAGRGENGITGTITVDPLPVRVVAAEQPTQISATFDAVSSEITEDASQGENQQAEAVIEEANAPVTHEELAQKSIAQEEAAQKSIQSGATETSETLATDETTTEADAPEALPETSEATEATDVVEPQPERTKSNLFAAPEPVAEAAPAPEAETLAPAPVEETTAPAKPRTIFD